MKKFFEDVKKDIKFKSAGPGKKLTDDSSSRPPPVRSAPPPQRRPGPNEGAQMAGAAALARVEQLQRPRPLTSQDAIRIQVKKELEAEAAATAVEGKPTAGEGSRLPAKEGPAALSVTGVFFTCPLTGATLAKSERETHIKEAILMRFAEDPVEASIMMIHTFNKDRERVKSGIDIITKYIDNICKHPEEEKYRKIKVHNKVFQEKLRSLDGSREFLQAVGFESQILPVEGKDDGEEFLVLPEGALSGLEELQGRLSRLQAGGPVRAQLDRQPQVYRPSPLASRFDLPLDFYNLTAEELKREQQLKSEVVERNAMLRTKAMRERDEQRERRKYSYCLLRVRLPDGHLLQGTFLAGERVSALYRFVRDSLLDDWQPFELVAPGGQRLQEHQDPAQDPPLNECNLAPAVVLSLCWDAAVQADIEAAGAQNHSVLKPELMQNARTLS